jgi:3-oxoacyl-[acyl-carrier protein] reductase
VTGANHGIGAATAVELARLGADVALTYLRLAQVDDPGRPEAYAAERAHDASSAVAMVRAEGVRAHALESDLCDPDMPSLLFDEVEGTLGPVSILVHNASGWCKDSFAPTGADRFGRRSARVGPDTFDAQFLVDARAGALLMAELAERHRRRSATWGRIVTLTSGGPGGFPGEVSYGAAKAALENYTMSASVELAGLGITANVVHPPVTDTGWVTDDVRRFVEESTDHVHVAQPAEVAEVIGWLCSEEARLVSGNIVRLR